MRPRHLTILFALLAAALLPRAAHAQYSSCTDFACDSYGAYDPYSNEISGYSRTVDYWWEGWYLFAESLLGDPNGETAADVYAGGYSEAEADVSYAPGPSGGYEVHGVHSYGLEDNIAYDGDSYYDVWVAPPPVVSSPTGQLTWYSLDPSVTNGWYSIDMIGTGFTDQPWISGCDGGIDQSSWLVDSSTDITGSLHVSTGLSSACTVHVWVDGVPAFTIALTPGAPPAPPTLSCPQTVTRGGTVTCTVTGGAVTQWSFSGQSADGTTAFSITEPSPGPSWSGVMVASGTVSATVGGQTLTKQVTVTARSGFASVAMPPVAASQAPMGTCGMDVLTSPPNPPPPPPEVNRNPVAESAYCVSFGPPALKVDSGPNRNLYFVTPFSDSSSYPWELNPGVTNPDDDFYQHQGACFPSISVIVADAEEHEFGTDTTSHYTEMRDFLAVPAQNPGPLAESIVRNSAQDVIAAIQAKYQAAVNAGSQEPPNGLPDNINYPPYRTCDQ
jgi:hypothetical protein